MIMVYTLMFRAARQHLQRTTTITTTITTTTTTQQWGVRRCSGTQIAFNLWPRPLIQAVWVLGGPTSVLGGPMSVPGGPTSVLRRTFSLDSSLRNSNYKPSVSRHQGGIQPSTAQKVKEAGKDFTYLIVILIGLGVTGGLLYAVFHELFSASSPNTVYGKAFDRVKAHPEVIGAFGEPLKCYGEATRRQRRQHVSHVDYVKDGLKHMRIKFYIEGSEPGMKGTVHTESKENIETGKYEFRYIFVEVDTYPRRTIVVEDNR